MKAEWAGRTAFAEVAEAVGISTEMVVGMADGEGGVLVIYTTPEQDATGKGLWGDATKALLRRDPDGILVIVSGPTVIPDFFAEARQAMDGAP